jgi:hypothetical protein
MPLSENQRWILNLLSDNGGRWSSGVPCRETVTPDQMQADLLMLRDDRRLAISGPPNQNSNLGYDIDEIRLLR